MYDEIDTKFHACINISLGRLFSKQCVIYKCKKYKNKGRYVILCNMNRKNIKYNHLTTELFKCAQIPKNGVDNTMQT